MQAQTDRRSAGCSLAVRTHGAVLFGVLSIGVAAYSVRDSAAAGESSAAGFRVVAAAGRNAVLLPSAEATAQVPMGAGAILGRSHETARHRIHEVTLEGRTYRAATPLHGPASRIAFDLLRHRFVRLLPSIRVECANNSEAESIARQIGATQTRYLDRLGIAILTLPDDLHPAEAADRVNAQAGRDMASVRFHRRRPQWK